MPRHRADPSPPESATGSQHETLTLARATAWYRSTPRARGIVAAASGVFVAGWAWNLTGLWR